jgi:DNA-binding transcriptional ArsR family regulator
MFLSLCLFQNPFIIFNMATVVKYQINREKLEKAAAILRVVAHPTRLAIVDLLDLNARLSVKQSLLSHHLKNMRLTGILRSEKEGQNVFYSLKERDVTKLIACIEHCDCNM